MSGREHSQTYHYDPLIGHTKEGTLNVQILFWSKKPCIISFFYLCGQQSVTNIFVSVITFNSFYYRKDSLSCLSESTFFPFILAAISLCCVSCVELYIVSSWGHWLLVILLHCKVPCTLVHHHHHNNNKEVFPPAKYLYLSSHVLLSLARGKCNGMETDISINFQHQLFF